MRQSVRIALRQTQVRTAMGQSVGWLDDLEYELETGQLVAIAVVATRWWRFHPIWIPRAQIVRWDTDGIVVEDAWSTPEKARIRPGSLPVQAPSCYAERS